MITLSLDHNFEDLEIWIDSLKEKAAVQAARSSINKVLLSTRKLSIKLISRHYKLRPSGLSRKQVKAAHKIIKARGGRLESIAGEIQFSGRPIPMIKFVTGSKAIMEQKGIKIVKRRKLKVQIRPGKKVILKGAFIGKVHSKQVFKRGGKGLKRQAVPSLTEVSFQPENITALEKHIQRRFPDVFANQLQFRIDKLTDKLNRKPLKKA